MPGRRRCQGLSKRIQWRERFYFVEEVEDLWREQPKWWAKPEKRTNFRVRTKKQQVILVHVEHDSGRWTLAGFYD